MRKNFYGFMDDAKQGFFAGDVQQEMSALASAAKAASHPDEGAYAFWEGAVVALRERYLDASKKGFDRALELAADNIGLTAAILESYAPLLLELGDYMRMKLLIKGCLMSIDDHPSRSALEAYLVLNRAMMGLIRSVDEVERALAAVRPMLPYRLVSALLLKIAKQTKGFHKIKLVLKAFEENRLKLRHLI